MKTLLLTLLLVPMMSFGQNNYSMSFDGQDDYIQLGNASFLPNNSFTISTWFNSLGVTSGNDDIFVSDVSWSTYTIRMGAQGNISFRIQPNAGSGGSVTTIETSGNGINYSDGNWHHFTCTWDGNNMAVYINGILFSQVSTSFNSVGFTNDNATIGSYPTTTQEFFNGKLDDFQIWDTALTEQEIQDYMNCPPTGTESGLVGYWNFEEGSGTTAYDLTSNGNNGTINGATYSTDVPVQNCCVATSSTDVITACDSYTWVDGNTYTASTNNPNPTLHTINAGSYYYLPSTLTINAGDVVEWINDGGFHDVNGETNTITGLPYNNPEVFNSPSTSVVGAVIYSHTFTIPGTYEYDCSVGQHAANGMVGTITVLPPPPTFTTINAAGCDSVITLDLTINYSNTGTDVITACDSYTWLDGNTYTTSNNTATWTETNAAGCDSVVTLDLTINNSSSSTDIVTACDSYSWVDGNTYTASNNTATYTTTNAAGCDSTITLDLTITPQSTSSIIKTACSFYIAPDDEVYTSTGNYTAIIDNAAGCDSVITIDLTINPTPSAAVTQNGATLTATQTGATYQWIDCDDESNIVGEINQAFTPTTTGSYAVIVTIGDCFKKSDCFLVDFTGIGELNNTPKQLIKIVDVLGRETPFKPNTPLLYIYNDGTVERKMIIK